MYVAAAIFLALHGFAHVVGFVSAVATASLALSKLGLPESKVGIPINIVVIVALLLARPTFT